MYVSVIKSTNLAFGNRLKKDSAGSSKVSGISVKLFRMTFPSVMRTASVHVDLLSIQYGIPNYREVLTCLFCRHVVSSCQDNGTGPKGNDKVSLRSTLCSVERRTS